ncbi:MAG: hypothetical protein U9N59_10600 [Campylobacterota bacterium]|nr:hypothetical protein [Campylobacterota bacterium]
MKSKKIVFSFLILVLIPIIFFFGMIFIKDPLKVFHQNWFGKNLYMNKHMYEQAPGIIKNNSFDSIIIGTSMLKNTLSAEASKYIKGDFINLSLSGGSHNERSMIMNYAIQNKKIKNVIYSLDYYTYDFDNFPKRFSPFLFDNNIFNDFQIYMNDKYLKYIFFNLNKNKFNFKVSSLDRPLADFNLKKNIDRFDGLENWINNKTPNNKVRNKKYLNLIKNTSKKIKQNKIKKLFDVDKEFKKQKKGIDKYVLNTVVKNPNTNFICVFPPHYRFRFARWAQYMPDKFELNKKIIKYYVEKSSTYNNLKVYGFEDRNFLDKIENYKDTAHYHYSINAKMLKWISKENGLLTKDNIDEYLKIIENKALSFNIHKLSDKINLLEKEF